MPAVDSATADEQCWNKINVESDCETKSKVPEKAYVYGLTVPCVSLYSFSLFYLGQYRTTACLGKHNTSVWFGFLKASNCFLLLTVGLGVRQPKTLQEVFVDIGLYPQILDLDKVCFRHNPQNSCFHPLRYFATETNVVQTVTRSNYDQFTWPANARRLHTCVKLVYARSYVQSQNVQ